MGATPMQQGQGPGLSDRTIGEQGGEPTVTLLSFEMPAHTHLPFATSDAGDLNAPAPGAIWASARSGRVAADVYSTAAPDLTMNPAALGLAGGGQPHNNMPPYLAVSFIIALQGVFPPRP